MATIPLLMLPPSHCSCGSARWIGISSVLNFCGRLLDDKEVDDDDDDDASDADAGDLEAFCKNLDEGNASMSYAEKTEMITVADEYSKGSVEMARGGRMTVVKTQTAKGKRRQTLLKEVDKRRTVMKARLER